MSDISMVVIVFAFLVVSGYYLKPVAENLFWQYMYKKHKKPGSEISMSDFRMLLTIYWRIERQEWVRRTINRLYSLPARLLTPVALALDADLLIDWTNGLIRMYHFRLYSSYFNRAQQGADKPNYIRVESLERKNDIAFVTMYFEGDTYTSYVKHVKSALHYYANIPKDTVRCKKVDAHHILCIVPENLDR